MEKTMEFLFVYSDEAWYLKIDTVEQLMEYFKLTSTKRFEKAIEMYLSGIRPDMISSLPLQERIQNLHKNLK